MAGGTNFEGIEHGKLKSMVATTDPGKVTGRGTQLKAAGRVLDDLSRALAAHLGQIQWEGPAAENFKAWATDLNKSATMISEYSKGAGEAMVEAGEALSSAKTGVPEVPKTDIATVDRHGKQPSLKPSSMSLLGIGSPTAITDAIMKKEDPTWVSSAEAQAAQKRVEVAHQEAIHQMEKLGQAYEAATTKLNGLKLPELPGTGGPGAVDGGDEVSVGGGGGRGGSGGGSVRSPKVDGGSGSYGPPSGGDRNRGPGLPPPSVPPTPGPQYPGRPEPTPTPPPVPPRTLPPLPTDPGGVVPGPAPTHPSLPQLPGTDINSVPTLPTVPGPTTPGVPGIVPPSGPGVPGTPGGPGGGPAFPGTGPTVFPGFPGGGGGSTQSRTGSVNPSRPSTFGGGPASSKNGAPATGGGPVFGSREAQAGRSGAPGGPGGMGAGGMHGGAGGGGATGSRGRGLTSTGGGTVGGRKGPTAGGEFTPGGSGLRNRAGGAGGAGGTGPEGGSRSGQNGMMGGGAAGGAGRSERDRRKRADYLHEDDETWTNGTPQSNPGVIE